MPFPEGFEITPWKMAGNTQSAHKVVFGILDGEDVAVKPFKDEGQGIRECMRMAEHEEAMYKLVGELGYLTFVPTGIVETKRAALLFTRYEPDLMSGSTLPLSEVGNKNSEGLIVDPTNAVIAMAKAMAHLHNDNITHGDAKPRNFSFHRTTGIGPIVVDLEVTQDHRKTGKRHEYFVNLVRADIRSFSESLGNQGFGGRSMKEAWNLLDGTVLDPYHEVAEQPLPASAINAARNGLMFGRGEFFSEETQKAIEIGPA